MDKSFISSIRRSLLRHKTNLLDWLSNGNSSGRLPFGGETSPENLEIISKIDTALDRVEQGTFGKCELCSGEVEPERLMLDFTTCVCLDHYSEAEIRELERDLELAAKVQRHLLPETLPVLHGVEMAAMARPASAVGGDYYDFFRYKKQHQGLAIADVMGKGIPASMLMANLQASLRIMGPDYPELSALAIRLNELFRYNLKQVRFITLFLAGFDPVSREIEYINAGHHPPLLWRASSDSGEWLKPTGPAIGLIPEANYTSRSLQLNDGDLLIMYTDGLVEARNGDNKEFGVEGLAQFTAEHFAQSPDRYVNQLLDKVKLFGASIKDDLTLLVLKMAGAKIGDKKQDPAGKIP